MEVGISTTPHRFQALVGLVWNPDSDLSRPEFHHRKFSDENH
jgi:hypothetical protein